MIKNYHNVVPHVNLKVLDLFSGIGGFTLGLHLAGLDTISFVEKDGYAIKVLQKNFPEIPIIKDIKNVKKTNADIICGGFPCQPFSGASHGNIVAIDLSPEFARVVNTSRPKYVIAENVSRKAIIKLKNQLKGYFCEERNISAAFCGADHKRDRWWLFAHTNDKSEFFGSIYAEVAKLPQICGGLWTAENYARTIRVSNGLSNRMDRFRCLGNTIIPYIPYAIGLGIVNYELDSV